WAASGTAATELGTLGTTSSGSTRSQAYAINTAGTTVGYSDKFSGGLDAGERPVREGPTGTAGTGAGNLCTDASGFSKGEAYAINSAGAAVGYVLKFSGGTNLGPRAIRWDASGITATELGNLGTNSLGGTNCYAYAINAAGVTVGNSEKWSGGTSL